MWKEFAIYPHPIIPVFIIVFVYEFIAPIKYLNNLLEFLGIHSMNIFLIHKDADAISENLAKLRESAEEKNKDTFLSVSKKTKRQLLRLKQSELPDLENIL